jgi:prophage regulatory protein
MTTQPTGEELLRIRAVAKKTGIATSTLYAMVANGTFPRPIAIKGMRIKAWPLSRVEHWIAEQVEAAA